jgi:hypothetical protein
LHLIDEHARLQSSYLHTVSWGWRFYNCPFVCLAVSACALACPGFPLSFLKNNYAARLYEEGKVTPGAAKGQSRQAAVAEGAVCTPVELPEPQAPRRSPPFVPSAGVTEIIGHGSAGKSWRRAEDGAAVFARAVATRLRRSPDKLDQKDTKATEMGSFGVHGVTTAGIATPKRAVPGLLLRLCNVFARRAVTH